MSPTPSASVRSLSPEAQAAAGWLRQLARSLRMIRLYRTANPVAIATQRSLADSLIELLEAHRGWDLSFGASTIALGGEVIVQAAQHKTDEGPTALDQLPFLFYRDGIRRMSLAPNVPPAEVDALLDALRRCSQGPDAQDDLVTLLWQANLNAIRFEAVPPEQIIYLSSRPGGERSNEGRKGQVYAWSPNGAEVRAELGQFAGAQGLHKDTFDDWPIPAEAVDPIEAFTALTPAFDFAREHLATRWAEENAQPWTEQAVALSRTLIALEPSEDMRGALARAVVTWVGASFQRAEWEEARRALDLLEAIDPGRMNADAELKQLLDGLDATGTSEALDEADAEDLARFVAMAVALGPVAVAVTCEIMAHCGRARSRAAACTALCWLAADDPLRLGPWLRDSRWHVVRNVVFALGHIGGEEVVPLLAGVASHPEPRVRRQVVHALGNVPHALALPMLFQQLDTDDAQLLAVTLATLTRESDPLVAPALLQRITASDFESRPEPLQRALFGALAEVAGDTAVPALEELLHRGGWFARRSFARTAAARMLARIGTAAAHDALERALRARADAVRLAAVEALAMRSAA